MMFSHTGVTGSFSPLGRLRLNKNGVIREFPDLINEEDWQKIAIERMDEHLSKMKSENEVCEYAQSELKKYGYVPKMIKKDGFRPMMLSK